MASVSLKPLGDRILVEPIDAEEKTAGALCSRIRRRKSRSRARSSPSDQDA